ncbi:MAG: hypothetical protein ACHQ1H_09845 [Nitrososphaerales archaeon]
MSTTITEALAEIKTIGKRIEKKRQSVATYLARDFRLKDPLEKDGGSVKFIVEERQGISDLENRIVSIRTAIQKSNLATQTTVGNRTMTVAEWLTWRREVSSAAQGFLNSLNSGIRQIREKAQRDGGRVVSNATETEGKVALEVIVNIDEKALLEEQENMEKTLGELDGRLSLLNATTVVDF